MSPREPDPLPRFESFEHVVQAAKVRPGDPVTTSLIMGAADRQRLAAAFGVPGVETLSGEAMAARRGGVIEVEGTVRARLTRECVASLEEMTEVIEEAFSAAFTEEAPQAVEGEVEADLDAPEPIEGGALDLGAVLIEQLVLAMDPHPRIEGAEAPADPGAGARITPFDVLKQMQAARED